MALAAVETNAKTLIIAVALYATTCAKVAGSSASAGNTLRERRSCVFLLAIYVEIAEETRPELVAMRPEVLAALRRVP